MTLSFRTAPVALAALTLATVGLTGCGGDKNTQTTQSPGPVGEYEVLAPGMAEPVTILRQQSGDDAAFAEPMVRLIKSQQELDRLGSDALSPLSVNFDNESLIVATAGEQPTGGYWIRIDSVQREGNELIVEGTANRPGDDAMTTQALTHPYTAVVIPATDAQEAVPFIDSVQGQQPPQD